MTKPVSPIVNVDDAPEETRSFGEWGGHWKALTPSMRERGGTLGVNRMRLPPGHVMVPFHYHLREDEVFYVLAGRGVLRYGDELYDIGPGDCIACPAGTKTAHQIANPSREDLVYLAIGPWDPHEVCVYPDSGKVLIRGVSRIGFMEDAEYMEGEPGRPKVFDLIEHRKS